MAKKKRLTSGGSPAKWSDSQQISLLAWLDHTLNHDDLDFNDTVVAYLESAFKLPQIETKLKLLWDKLGPNGGTNWRSDLFTYGSSCLHDGLSDDSKEAISNLVRSLDDGYIARQLATPTRQLRKRARSSIVSEPRKATPAHLRTLKSESTEAPRSIKRSFQSESVTPSTLRKESEIPRFSPRVAESPNKRQKKKPNKNLIKYHSPSKRKNSLSNYIQKGRKSKHSRTVSKTTITDSEEALSETEIRDDVQLENRLQQNSCDKKPKIYKAFTSSDSVHEKKEDKVRCICGAEERTGKLQDWIQCDGCMVWQHTRCVECRFAGPGLPEKYSCEKCEPVGRAKQVNLSDDDLTLLSAAEEKDVDLGVTSNQPGGNPRTSQEDGPSSQLDLRLESAKNEIKNLQEQLKQRDREIQESVASEEAQERECCSLREAQRQRDKQTGRPIEETIQEYNSLKKKLQADTHKRDTLSKFSRLLGNSRQWFGKIELQDGFQDVYSQSQQMLCRNDGDKLPFLPKLDRFGKLRELIYGCLALDSGLVRDSEVAMNTLSKLTPQAVVRGLTTWALRDWVFEQDFPCFDKCQSDILDAYRNILSRQDGAIVLRNLDLAATESLVKSDHLQRDVIPEKAKALAISLSQTLEPLFTDNPGSTIDWDWDGFATWRDVPDEWRERRDRLTKMFEVALKVKADSCLNIETYEMVIYPPGTKFDQNTMRVETPEGMLDTVNDHTGRVVELCIQAAVFAYARQPLMNNDSVSKAVISSKNFVRKELKDRLTISPRVKAVVLLKDAPS